MRAKLSHSTFLAIGTAMMIALSTGCRSTSMSKLPGAGLLGWKKKDTTSSTSPKYPPLPSTNTKPAADATQVAAATKPAAPGNAADSYAGPPTYPATGTPASVYAAQQAGGDYATGQYNATNVAATQAPDDAAKAAWAGGSNPSGVQQGFYSPNYGQSAKQGGGTLTADARQSNGTGSPAASYYGNGSRYGDTTAPANTNGGNHSSWNNGQQDAGANHQPNTYQNTAPTGNNYGAQYQAPNDVLNSGSRYGDGNPSYVAPASSSNTASPSAYDSSAAPANGQPDNARPWRPGSTSDYVSHAGGADAPAVQAQYPASNSTPATYQR